MRVVVPALSPGCTATLALTAEGVPHDVRVLVGDLEYGALVEELWDDGQGFVLVEHDVAPWFGAVAQLAECERDWCMFHYPKAGGMLIRGLGCTKFSDRLVRDYPDLPDAWKDTDWRILDGAVAVAITETLRAENPRHSLCPHDPPVAHVRRPD